MKKVLSLIVVVVCVVAVSAVAVYYYHKKDRPPEVVDYKDFAALQKDVERLEAARGKGGLSWQDGYRLGVAYIQSGRVQDAIAPLEESRKYNPSFVKTHESLGTAYFRTGRMKEAIEAWQNAMKLNPEAKFLDEMVSMARGVSPGQTAMPGKSVRLMSIRDDLRFIGVCTFARLHVHTF